MLLLLHAIKAATISLLLYSALFCNSSEGAAGTSSVDRVHLAYAKEGFFAQLVREDSAGVGFRKRNSGWLEGGQNSA